MPSFTSFLNQALKLCSWDTKGMAMVAGTYRSATADITDSVFPTTSSWRSDGPSFQPSFDTTDKREAIWRREVEGLKWSARFASCATEPATSPVGSDSPLSRSALADLVRSHVEEVVGWFEARYAADLPESEAQKGEMRADIEIGRQVLQSADDPRADE